MDEFKDRLKEALAIRKMSAAELSRLSGIDEGTLSNYKKGKYEPKQRKLESIAIALNVSVAWLMGADVPMKRIDDRFHTADDSVRAVQIPVLGYVRAGVPIDAVEEILDYEEITEEMARSGTYFCLKIKGDSMEPKFSEGDVVVIRQQETVENGDIAVILINGDDATIKKFYKSDAGVQLVATNPTYPPLLFTPQEVNNLPVSIIGKAVELRAKL